MVTYALCLIFLLKIKSLLRIYRLFILSNNFKYEAYVNINAQWARRQAKAAKV